MEINFSSCCPADPASPYYTSWTNLVPVIVYGNYQTSFVIQYRYGEHRAINTNFFAENQLRYSRENLLQRQYEPVKRVYARL